MEDDEIIIDDDDEETTEKESELNITTLKSTKQNKNEFDEEKIKSNSIQISELDYTPLLLNYEIYKKIINELKTNTINTSFIESFFNNISDNSMNFIYKIDDFFSSDSF